MTELTVCLTGDSLITRAWPGADALGFSQVAALVREADVAFTNLETPLHDYASPPAGESQGPRLRGRPDIANALVNAGFRLLSVANNHIMDWGVDGLQSTLHHLQAAGAVVAGAGDGLQAARAAQTLATARGRLALVACTTSFPAHARAGNGYGAHPPRPGVNILRHSRTLAITADQMTHLRAMRNGLQVPADWSFRPRTPHELNWLGQHFVTAESPGVTSRPHQHDLQEILAVVRAAHDAADVVLVSLHTHEQHQDDRASVPEFVRTSARAMIEAGADVVIGHGPHVLRGIECHGRGLICHSLGNFIFQPETLERLSADDVDALGLDPRTSEPPHVPRPARNAAPSATAESVAAFLTLTSGHPTRLRLVPLVVSTNASAPDYGVPTVATPEAANRILARVARFSAALGTRVEIRDHEGWVELAPSKGDPPASSGAGRGEHRTTESP